MLTSALEMRQLRLSYGAVIALRDVNLTIPQGSRCALVGPNGAGKSTLLKAALGLAEVQQGEIRLLAQTDKLEKIIETSVAYIPQAQEVNWQFPATVEEIVMMGRFAKIKGWLKRPSQEDWRVVEVALNRMQLSDLRHRQIDQLSGGQRQRVFIARALAQEATLYLMDEPLAGVDIQTEEIIMSTLKAFQEQGKTSIVIHHDLQSLSRYFDYLVWVNQTVIAAGPIDEVLTQVNYEATYRQAKQGLFTELNLGGR